jgi:hypothetical protein
MQLRLEKFGSISAVKPSVAPSDRTAVVVWSITGDRSGRVTISDGIDVSILGYSGSCRGMHRFYV